MFEIFAEYPTFLTFLAFVLAAAITLVIMPLFIKFLRRVHIGQQVRADGPQSHLVKQGTPTMGGVVMLVAIAVVAVAVSAPTSETLALVACTLLAGALGLFDDASKVVKERSLGLTPKAKLRGAVPHLHVLLPVRGERARRGADGGDSVRVDLRPGRPDDGGAVGRRASKCRGCTWCSSTSC